MSSIFTPDFLTRHPVLIQIKKLSASLDRMKQVLDIGCGFKPYAKLFAANYTGVDLGDETYADIVCNSAAIPLASSKFDAIICTETLQHVDDIEGTIDEIYRLLKPGGTGLITIPYAMKLLSTAIPSDLAPVHNFNTKNIPWWRNDYRRFTKFGLLLLFKKFNIIEIRETSGYIGTLCQGVNYFLASMHVPLLFIPWYTINNLLGSFFDNLVWVIVKIAPWPTLNKFYDFVYSTWPIGYTLLVRKPAEVQVNSTE